MGLEGDFVRGEKVCTSLRVSKMRRLKQLMDANGWLKPQVFCHSLLKMQLGDHLPNEVEG